LRKDFFGCEKMKYIRIAGMSILLALTVGCSSVSTAPTQTVNGNWNLQLTSFAVDGTSYIGFAKLIQSGNDITGTVIFKNAPCATTGSLKGSVSGADVTFQLTEGSQVVTLTGTINSVYTSMSGNYNSPSGGCLDGDHGSWAAGG
jgi:hypothetical protein